MRRTITRRERDLLWEECARSLECQPGVHHGYDQLMEEGQLLLDVASLFEEDLGWEKDGAMEDYTLTLPDEQLARIAGRVVPHMQRVIREDFEHGMDEYLTGDRDLLALAMELGGREAVT